jgi:Tfp pilus assembly protein PilP
VRRLAILPVLLALALSGCGAGNDSAGDFEGDEQDVARAIEDLEEAAQEEEPRRICEDLLSRELLATLGSDCVGKIQRALDQADTFALTVESVRVTGTTARAQVETGLDEENVELVELVREGEDWKVAGLPGAG